MMCVFVPQKSTEDRYRPSTIDLNPRGKKIADNSEHVAPKVSY
jgi:hypothetical protein